MRIGSQLANIHASASIESETTSQALLGEQVKVFKVKDQWSQIELKTDGYRGFVENHHLVDDSVCTTHRVSNKFTPLFDKPNIKSPVQQLVPIASELKLHNCENDQFLRTNHSKYVWKQHTQAIAGIANGQLVDTAQALFLGSPYLWGGRSPLGLDCSAMVQLSALLHGWRLPRDTSDQLALFHGNSHTTASSEPNIQSSSAQKIDYEQRQTNDLIYWPGHVAIVLNKAFVVHATAHSLQCCCEKLLSVEERAGSPESIWRLTR